jgi:hypothetical protein
MWRLADPYGACAGGYHELSVMRDRFHWARLLAFVTGLVNQELLLRNKYLWPRIASSGPSVIQASVKRHIKRDWACQIIGSGHRFGAADLTGLLALIRE